MADKHRFTPGTEIIMLREAVAVDVGVDFDWDMIAQTVTATLATGTVNKRQCKERFDKLVKCFKQDQMKSLKASGTDEEYEERDVLLQEIVEKLDERKVVKEEKKNADKKKEDIKESQGKIIREAALQTLKAKTPDKENELSDDDMEYQPVKKRYRKQGQSETRQDLLEILKQKNDIHEKEVDLMAKKFEAETDERKQMMQLIQTMLQRNQDK